MAKIHKLSRATLPWGDNHPIHRDPVPHIRRKTTKPIAGWAPSHQPLTAPRLLLNPYIGCQSGCEFCFLQGYPGLYRLGSKESLLTVYTNYHNHLKQELRKLRIAPPAIMSPYTDPFQQINDRYNLAEKIVKEMAFVNLPMEIVTRQHIPDEVLAIMEHLPAARIQVSIDPFGREGIVPHYKERLEFMDRIALLGLEVIPRLDPLFLGEKDAMKKIEEVIFDISQKKLSHVAIGLGRITPVLHSDFLQGREQYYRPHPYRSNFWLAKKEPRREFLSSIRAICKKYNLTLGVLEYPDLQEEFGDYRSCFNKELPVCIRPSQDAPFQPIENCGGNCLLCENAACGIDELRENPWRKQRITTTTWDKWGKQRLQEKLLP